MNRRELVNAIAAQTELEPKQVDAALRGFTDVVTHWPRSEGWYAGDEAVLDAVAADILPRLRSR